MALNVDWASGVRTTGTIPIPLAADRMLCFDALRALHHEAARPYVDESLRDLTPVIRTVSVVPLLRLTNSR